MKCPRCGHEMVMDGHRKIDMFMCYECGYIEGRNIEDGAHAYHESKLEHLHAHNVDLLMGRNFAKTVH